MSRNDDARHLVDLIRDEVAAALRSGGGRGRDVARRIREANLDLMDRLGGRLADEAVARRANREFKRSLGENDPQSEQYVLQGVLRHIRRELPLSISVPAPDDEEDEGPIYRPLFGEYGATVAELRAAIGALWKQIGDDTRHARALGVLLNAVIELGAGDDDRVGDALRRSQPEPA